MEVLIIDDKPYFPATECAKILGYKMPEKAIRTHCEGVSKMDTPTLNQYGATVVQKVNYIPEGDLYRLIIRSKLSAARRFERWVVDEVLPTIRQYGAYITGEMLRKMQDDETLIQNLLVSLSAEKAQNSFLLNYAIQAEHKVLYYDTILQNRDAIPITLIAKDYSMSAMKLNKILRDLRVQHKAGKTKTWVLYAKYHDLGLTVSKTFPNGNIHTYWTQKGRQFLYELLNRHGILPLNERKGVIA